MALVLGLTFLAAACASSREGGAADYDALKAATADCAAKGGTLQLVRNGDPQVLGDYACRRN